MSEPVEETRAPAAVRTRSKGEQLFDWLTYGGVAGIGTFVTTIPLAYLMKYRGGDKWLENTLAKAGLKGGFLRSSISTTSLMQGGNVMLIPVGILEANHLPIIDGFNKMLGDPTPKETIAAKPQQNWLSLIGGRLLAWCVVFTSLFSAATLFPRSFGTFKREFGMRTCELLGKPVYRDPEGKLPGIQREHGRLAAERALAEVNKADKATLETIGVSIKEVENEMARLETRTFRYGKMAALDIFATAAAAALLYVGSHFFANRMDKQRSHHAPASPGPALLRDEIAEPQAKGFAKRIAAEREQAPPLHHPAL